MVTSFRASFFHPDLLTVTLRSPMVDEKEFDKNELRERLTPTQYQVTQEHHTEK